VQLVANLLLFVRSLRAAGAVVPPGAALGAIAALEQVGIQRRDDVRGALRAVLVNRYEDLARFDRLFDRFWRTWPTAGSNLPQPIQPPRRAITKVQWLAGATVPPEAFSADEQQDRPDIVRTYSAIDQFRTKDFAVYNAEEAARARAMIAAMKWTPGVRRTRRWTGGAGDTIDLRRLLRVNARHGGEPLLIPRRARRTAPRSLVLLCDISGSMEPYTRMLLLFAHAMARRQRSVELFVFSTHLTRITKQFSDRSIDVALARLREVVKDWSGGTRIGEALRAFHVRFGRRVLRRGPVVLLISDGWDLGDPEVLRTQMARLHRGCFRLVWLNPLIGTPGYEPLTRGMRAALPYVDDFLPVRNMVSLEALARHLETLPLRGDGRRSRRVEAPAAVPQSTTVHTKASPWT
jgi:uncharacterized protein with von Willebrand factor type A (vWA) domain